MNLLLRQSTNKSKHNSATYWLDSFVFCRVFVTCEVLILKHRLESIVLNQTLHILVRFEKLVHKLLIDFHFLTVRDLLDLDALTLFFQSLLDLVLTEFLVGKWVLHSYELVVGLQLHKVPVHVGPKHWGSHQV